MESSSGQESNVVISDNIIILHMIPLYPKFAVSMLLAVLQSSSRTLQVHTLFCSVKPVPVKQ